MRTKRIVLLKPHSLLAAGVQRLLEGMEGVELSIVEEDDPEATAKIKKLAPQVIVLDSSAAILGPGTVTRLLDEHPKARVIAVNLYRTDITVYRMKRVLETSPDGLLEAIHGKGRPAVNRPK